MGRPGVRTKRIGILGAGLTGKRHARALKRIDGAKIVAVCDRNPERAEELIAEQQASGASNGPTDSAPKAYTECESMIRDSELDALYICIQPYAHSGEVELAASHNVNVFIEKPVALTAAKALEMTECSEAAAIITQVGYMLRYSGAVRRLKQLIEDGTAGRPTLFQGRYACNSLHSPWWRDRSKSGGQMFEQAIHIYDAALHLFGSVSSVSALKANLCHRNVPDYTVEDTSVSTLEFENGALGSISASNCAVPNRWEHHFTVVCERLVATITNGKHLQLSFTGEGEVREEVEEYDEDLFFEEDRAFLSALDSGAPSACPIRVGYDGVKLLETATRSAESRRVLEL